MAKEETRKKPSSKIKSDVWNEGAAAAMTFADRTVDYVRSRDDRKFSFAAV